MLSGICPLRKVIPIIRAFLGPIGQLSTKDLLKAMFQCSLINGIIMYFQYLLVEID